MVFVEILDFGLNAIETYPCQNFPTNFDHKIVPKIKQSPVRQLLDIMENYFTNNMKQVLTQIGHFQTHGIDFNKLKFLLTETKIAHGWRYSILHNKI